MYTQVTISNFFLRKMKTFEIGTIKYPSSVLSSSYLTPRPIRWLLVMFSYSATVLEEVQKPKLIFFFIQPYAHVSVFMWVVEINHFSRVSFGQLGEEEFLPPSLLWSRKKCVRKNKMNASRLCQGFVKSSKSDYFWLKFNDLQFLFLRVVSSMLWRNRVRVNLSLAQLILLMRSFIEYD